MSRTRWLDEELPGNQIVGSFDEDDEDADDWTSTGTTTTRRMRTRAGKTTTTKTTTTTSVDRTRLAIHLKRASARPQQIRRKPLRVVQPGRLFRPVRDWSLPWSQTGDRLLGLWRQLRDIHAIVG